MHLETLVPFVNSHASIYIRKRITRGRPQYELRLRFTYRSTSTLAMIRDDYGGSLRQKNKYSATLEMSGAQALRILEGTEYFLVRKAAQAKLGIKFQHHKHKTAGGNRVTDAFLQTEEEMYQKMRRLNSSATQLTSNDSCNNVMRKGGDSGRGESESYLENEDDGKSRICDYDDGNPSAMRHLPMRSRNLLPDTADDDDGEDTIVMYKGRQKMIIDLKTNRIVGGNFKPSLW